MIRVSLWLLWTVVSGALAAGLWQAWRSMGAFPREV
jgi:hypothetical protein